MAPGVTALAPLRLVACGPRHLEHAWFNVSNRRCSQTGFDPDNHSLIPIGAPLCRLNPNSHSLIPTFFSGGENGFNQAIELAADMLANVKFVQEKKLIGK